MCIMNFIIDVLEQCLVVLEGGIGVLVLVLGQVVIIYVFQIIVEVGDNIVVFSVLYGGSFNLLVYMLLQYGIQVCFVDLVDFFVFVVLIDECIKVVFVELIGNLCGNVIDIVVIVEVVYVVGVLLIVDNIVVMLFLLCLFEYGVDIVVYLLIKYLGGYGNSFGGVIIDFGCFDWVVQLKCFVCFN